MSDFNKNLKPVLDHPALTLSQLRQAASDQLALLDKIKVVLPDNLQNHTLHCLINGAMLVVFTDSANWATQLRFYSQAILDLANAHTAGNVSAVRVKILSTFNRQKPTRKPLIPSQSTLAALKSHSDAVSEPQLKASLMRLSATLVRLQHDKA